MAEGIIKKFDKGFGFIRRAGLPDLFFHQNQWRGQNRPVLDQAVTFEEGTGRDGRPAALNVTPVGENQPAATPVPGEQTAGTQPKPGYRFLNPYNFVRYLDPPRLNAGDPPEAQLMGRCPPPPHDRWLGLSGEIECRAEAVTPVFVSDSEDAVQGENGHGRYRFFNVAGRKAIPASSLRGAVRAVFEAVTNSCFANFDSQKRLSYRLDTRDARRLVPARVKRLSEGQWGLELLTGPAELTPKEPPKELYAAAVRQYRARRPTGKRQGPPPPPVSLDALGELLTGEALKRRGPAAAWHGRECWGVLVKVKFPPSWRLVGVATDEAAANRLRQQQAAHFHSPLAVRRGWLCLTNQNADNKNSERFFFVDGQPLVIPLPDPVRRNYEALIADYQERHQTALKKRKQPGLIERFPPPKEDEVALSRFVLNPAECRLSGKGDELVYAMLSGSGPDYNVEFIAPVSVPRVAYNHTIGELLPNHLHHCDSPDALCPACRLFGWVHGDEEGAYAGRLHFSHAWLEQPQPQSSMGLAVLGSPKPTTTRFYLLAPDGKPRRKQEDKTIGYDGNNGRNRLRGRKFYRHYLPDPKQLHLPAEQQSDQNRTITDPEGAGALFTFRIAFENLAPTELGALLWALEMGGQGYLRLGYGKPLGLGSLNVIAETVRLRDPAARYTSLDDDGWRGALADQERRYLVASFQRGLAWPYASQALRYELSGRPEAAAIAFGELPHVRDLLAILNRKPPALPVHYPYSQEEFLDSRKSHPKFEWFVGNKRQHGPKYELDWAAEDGGLPLVDKQGNEY